MEETGRKLKSCYLHSLQLAIMHNCDTIAFPNISTGIYGFPKDRAAAIAMKTVLDFLRSDKTIKKVIFVGFDQENFERLLQEHENQAMKSL